MPHDVKEILRDFYAPEGPERVGFILDDGAVVEVENASVTPEQGFDICAEDLVTFGDRAVGSFHTHPGEPCNLSEDDYIAFSAWPDLIHYIVGSDGVQAYRVDDTKVVKHDAS